MTRTKKPKPKKSTRRAGPTRPKAAPPAPPPPKEDPKAAMVRVQRYVRQRTAVLVREALLRTPQEVYDHVDWAAEVAVAMNEGLVTAIEVLQVRAGAKS